MQVFKGRYSLWSSMCCEFDSRIEQLSNVKCKKVENQFFLKRLRYYLIIEEKYSFF